MRRKSGSRRKKPIKALKKRVWGVISKHVRERDGRCVTCGSTQNPQAGHYIHNSDKENNRLGGNELWYDLRNINQQCSGCNLFKHGNLPEYAIYLQDKYGEGILKELRDLYNKQKSWAIEELEEIYNKYK